MAKEKKKKDKKSAKQSSPSSGLKALAENPLVADVVAAALVATASALKDSNRARALASHAGDELDKLSKSTAERGGALWDMALQIGKRSLQAIAGEEPKAAKAKPPKSKSPAKSTKAAARPAAKKKSAKAGSR